MTGDTGSYLRRQSSRALQKSTKRGGWWRLLLLMAGNGAALAILVWFGYQGYEFIFYSPKFDVKQVIFTGNQYTDIKSMRDSVELGFPKNLMRIDLVKLRNLVETDPWVKRAQVRRVLPETLRIDLRERKPVALAGIEDTIHVVDAEGTILDRYAPKYGKFDLPIIKGLALESGPSSNDVNERRMSLFLRAMEELDSEGDQYTELISEADVTDEQNLVVIPMDDTVRILLGHQDFLRRFRAHLKKLALYREMQKKYGGIDTIDLRYEKQIVYQPLTGRQPVEFPGEARNQ